MNRKIPSCGWRCRAWCCFVLLVAPAGAQISLHPSLLELVNILLRREAPARYEMRIYPVINQGQLAGPAKIVDGDYNADGLRDVLVVIAGGQCILMRNEGGGAFLYSHEINDGGTFDAVMADIDADPDDEIVIIDTPVFGPALSSVAVYDRNAEGFPVEKTRLGGFGEGFQAVRAASVNGDAHRDLVVLTDTGFRVFVGDGSGGFTANAAIAEGVLPLPFFGSAIFEVRDFSGDGEVDLMWVNDLGVLSFRKGNGDGTFQAATSYADSFFVENHWILILDHEDDDDADIVAVPIFGGQVNLAVNDGSGGFAEAVAFPDLPLDGSAWVSSVVDRTGDGRDDLLAAVGNTTVVYEQGAGGSYTAVTMNSDFALGGLPGDFDNDGLLDLLAYGGGLAVLKGSAGNLFSSDGWYAMDLTMPTDGKGDFLAAGALDGDAPEDLVTAQGTVLFGRADRDFDRVDLTDFDLNSQGKAAVIFNADTDLDADLAFVVGDDSPGGDLLQIWRQDAGRSFGVSASVPIRPSPRNVVSGDFDGDGRADLAISHDVNFSASVYRLTLAFGDGAAGVAEMVEVDLPVHSPNFTFGGRLFVEPSGGSGPDDLLFGFEHLTAGFQVANAVVLVRGNADRSLIAADPMVILGTSFSPNASPVANDLDGDGISEMIIANGPELKVMRRDGSLLGLALAFPPGPGELGKVYAADVSGDGLGDLVMDGVFPVTLFDSRGGAKFGPGVGHFMPAGNENLVSGDFDGDGRVDLAGRDSQAQRLGVSFQLGGSLGVQVALVLGGELGTTGLGRRIERLVERHGGELDRIVLADARDAAYPLIEALTDELVPPLAQYLVGGSTEATVTQSMADKLNALLDFLISKAGVALRIELMSLKDDLDADSLVGLPLELALVELGGTRFRVISVDWNQGGFEVKVPVVPQSLPKLDRMQEGGGWLEVGDTTVSEFEGDWTLRDPSPDSPSGIYRVRLIPNPDEGGD